MYDNFVLKIIRNSGETYQKYLKMQSAQQYMEMSKEDLIGYLSFLSVLLEHLAETTEEEKKALENFQVIFAAFCEKCRHYEFTEQEEKVFRYTIAFSLVYNFGFMNYEILSFYLNHYYFGKKPAFTPDELILLQAHCVHFINQMTASSIEISFPVSFSNSICSITRQNGKFLMKFAYSFYSQLLNDESLSEEDYYYLIVYHTFAILHEYAHSKQMLMLVDNKEYEESSRIREEIVVLHCSPSFYEKYHNNFLIEKEADQFALQNLAGVLQNMIPKKNYEISLKKLTEDLHAVYQKILPENKFDSLFSQEYHRVSHHEKEVMNCLK